MASSSLKAPDQSSLFAFAEPEPASLADIRFLTEYIPYVAAKIPVFTMIQAACCALRPEASEQPCTICGLLWNRAHDNLGTTGCKYGLHARYDG